MGWRGAGEEGRCEGRSGSPREGGEGNGVGERESVWEMATVATPCECFNSGVVSECEGWSASGPLFAYCFTTSTWKM